MSELIALKAIKSAYKLSLKEMKKALDDLQLRYDIIQEHLENVEEAIEYEEGDGVKQDYQCYRCGLWYDDKDTMKECVEECKEEGR